LKIARSLEVFKHSVTTIKSMSLAKLGRPRDEATKLKLSSNTQAHPIIVTKVSTGEIKMFTSIRKTTEFLGKHPSYIAKYLNKNNIYTVNGYTIIKKN